MADVFTEDRESSVLLEAATPDLYRSNAFRVLGLPVTASPGEVHKRKDRLKKSLQFDPSSSGSTLLPIIPKPVSEDIDQAAHRLLHDPISWLVDELFWFWPSERSEDDAGFRMLRENDLRGALSFWAILPPNSIDGAIALHNSAVLNHLLALDIELVLSATERISWHQKLEGYWSEAYSNWCRVADDDLFWSRLSTRIRELGDQLGDQRLTTGAARRLRRNLPTAIITIGVRLALRAAKDGDLGEVDRHLSYLFDSDFDRDLTDKILEREAAPLIEQIKRLCEPVPAASKATPRHANRLARGLIADTDKRLAAIDALLGEDHQVTAFTHDTVALALRGCLIDFGNETEEWEECCSLLEQTSNLARDAALREQIGKDHAQAKENLSSQGRQEETQRLSQELKTAITSRRVYNVTVRGGRAIVPKACTCCLGTPDLEQSVSYSWEESRYLQRYKRTMSFDFPWCVDCRHHQSEFIVKRAGLIAVVSAGSILVAVGVLSFLGRADLGPVIAVGSLLTTALLLLLGRTFHLRELSEDHACRELPVKMLGASDSNVSFRFYNPLYANRFAEANGVGAVEAATAKAPRGAGIVAKTTLVSTLLPSLVIAGIGHAIALSVIQDARQQRPVQSAASSPIRPSNPIDHPKSTTPTAGNNPRQRTDPSSERNVRERDVVAPAVSAPIYAPGLKERIDSAKARARSLESQLNGWESQLKSLSDQIVQYKTEIEQYERRMRLEIQVDEYRYKEILRTHNSLVIEHNGILAKHRSVRTEYENEIDSINEMVRRYNAGER